MPKRSYPTPEVRGSGQEEQPHLRAAAAMWTQEGLEELLHVQGQKAQPVRRYPSSKVRSSCEEISYVKAKRNPSKMVGVARGHQRAHALKPQSQKTSQSDHRTTVVSNSMKLSHAMWGHPRWMGHGGEV